MNEDAITKMRDLTTAKELSNTEMTQAAHDALAVATEALAIANTALEAIVTRNTSAADAARAAIDKSKAALDKANTLYKTALDRYVAADVALLRVSGKAALEAERAKRGIFGKLFR
jgi:hypothetical protein